MDNQKNTKESNQSIGSRIKELRHYYNLSLSDFGLKVNLSHVGIFKVESGFTKRPRAKTLEKIINGYGTTFEWLYFGIGNMLPNGMVLLQQDINEQKVPQSDICKNEACLKLIEKNKSLETETERLWRLLDYFTLEQKMTAKFTQSPENIKDN